MNPFSPALRELARIYDRQINRGSLWLAQRKLAKAETELGLLGWQQADFEGEAKRYLTQLNNYELEQSRQTNVSASLGLRIREAQEKRTAGRKQYEKERAALENEWEQAAEPVETTERHLTARREHRVDFDRPIAELDRELAEVEELQARLLAMEKLTPELRADLTRLRERALVIPNLQADLRLKEVQAANEIRALEEKLARNRPLLAEAGEKLHALDALFTRTDGALARQIAVQEREKETVERQINALEKAKNNPYREIGQALADSGIAPLNQPHALEAVQHCRTVVAGLARAISTSHETSRQQDRTQMLNSWLTLAAVVLLVLFIAWFLLR